MLKTKKKIEVDMRSIVVAISVVVTIVVSSTSASYAYGVSTTESDFRQRQIDQLTVLLHEVKEQALNYTEQEVGGLRSDWERMNEIVQKQIDELK